MYAVPASNQHDLKVVVGVFWGVPWPCGGDPAWYRAHDIVHRRRARNIAKLQENISLRIGSCEPRPANLRHLSTWLGYEDTVELVMRCISAPRVGYLVVCFQQRTQLLGSDALREPRLPAAAERRGLRSGNTSAEKPAGCDCAAIPGRRF